MQSFPFIMIGAMYENGGNTTHRFLDGHEELFVYPFESQLGTSLAIDHLASVFPAKYRWPVFRLGASSQENYYAIADEECRVRARTPYVSKFRDFSFTFSDQERAAYFTTLVGGQPETRAQNVAAFFEATRLAWHDRLPGPERPTYVGYSPIVTVDSAAVLEELPGSHFVHVVRNPWSAYADTKHRPRPLPMAHYLLGWLTVQLAALQTVRQYPGRFHILRFEDLVREPRASMRSLCRSVGLGDSPALSAPSWNGKPLREVAPWGTIRTPTPEQNRATARELTNEEQAQVADYTTPLLTAFDYTGFLAQ